MVCVISDEDPFVAFHDCSSFLVVAVSDHFSNDAAATAINATENQLMTLCRAVSVRGRAKILEPLLSKKYCHR